MLPLCCHCLHATQELSDANSTQQHTAHHSSQQQHSSHGAHLSSSTQLDATSREHTLRMDAALHGQHAGSQSAMQASTSDSAAGPLLQQPATGLLAAAQQPHGSVQQQHQHQHQHQQRTPINSSSNGAATQQHHTDTSTVLDQETDAVMDIQHQHAHKGGGSSSHLLGGQRVDAMAAAGVHQHKGLLRLSLLMAVTMTLHNLPEVSMAAAAQDAFLKPAIASVLQLARLYERR